MRKQVFSVSLPPPVILAIKGAVNYFGFRSQSSFIETAVSKYLEELKSTLDEEGKSNEN